MSVLTMCNVSGSPLVRESDLAFMTLAGAEIGVTSTKAFTTQLTALLMLTLAQDKFNGKSSERASSVTNAIETFPCKVEEALSTADVIETLAEEFADKNHSLFLGRGAQYPIAMESALKLKEISYIHAVASASGELTHGPLALIDGEIPVTVIAPIVYTVPLLLFSYYVALIKGTDVDQPRDLAKSVTVE